MHLQVVVAERSGSMREEFCHMTFSHTSFFRLQHQLVPEVDRDFFAFGSVVIRNRPYLFRVESQQSPRGGRPYGNAMLRMIQGAA